MDARISARALIAFAGAVLALTVVGELLYPPGRSDLAAALLYTSTTASFTVVGAMLAFRVPGNRIGWMLLTAGALMAIGVFSGGYSQASVAAGGSWPMTPAFAWLADLVFVPSIVIVLGGVPMVFPDGHLPSPRWRWLAWLLVLGTTLAVVGPALTPGAINEDMPIANPFGIEALEPWLPIADSVSALTALPAFLGAFAAVATRYRRGSSVERHQIRWLMYAALVGAIAIPVSFLFPGTILADVGWYVGTMALAALPISIGIAILRYRLYEIDRIISRTIGWALVTGILLAVFAGLVVGLQTLLAPVTDESTLAVAASTLVAFALFQPLRRRVQRAVDHRFDRARYDGERTAAAFAERLRDQVDLEGLERDVTATVELALRPGSTGVWIRNVRFHAPARRS